MTSTGHTTGPKPSDPPRSTTALPKNPTGKTDTTDITNIMESTQTERALRGIQIGKVS